MSANTHSTIDASAQRSHETIDAAASGAHNLASSHPIDRTAEAGHNASIRAQQATQDATYRAGNVAQDASNRAAYTAQDATNRAAYTAQDVTNRASAAADRTADRASNAMDTASAKTQQAAANTRDAASTAADKTRDAASTAQAKTSEALAQAQETTRRLSTVTSQRVHQLADSAAHHPLVQQTSEASQRQLNALDRELAKYGFLNEFENRTGVSKTYGVLGLGGVSTVIILSNLLGLAAPLTNAVGWLLPTYLSCRALESPQQGDDKQWLTYWIIFGLLNLLESAALRVILYYIPQYFTFKLAFLIWLLYPGQQNAQKVYHSLVRPLFQTGRASVNSASASSQYGRTNTLSSPGSANFVNSSTGFSSAGTTAADSTGYSTATNPFATAGGGAGVGGLHATSAGNAQGVAIPVAVYPL